MARVFLARVDGVGGFQRHVVLKCVRPERNEDESYLTMFLDEARLVATLHHQHVAQVYEIGVADDGTYFLAMEYLHGETVRSVLERARLRSARLPLDFALTVVCAAAAGLHHAHERRGVAGQPLGIVHRDVSPSNVLVGYDGAVKLIDFGIAKAEARSTRTQTGFIKGKAGYMAPEQALGYPVDRRSDVFALGVVLYELTSQVRAFRAPSEYEAVQRIVRGDVTPPSKLVEGYPPELEHVVMTALEVDPDDRFQDADAMRRAIELAAHHLGVGIGGGAVTRVLGDLFGSRPEPWLEAAPIDDEATTVTTESAPLLAAAPASSNGPMGIARGSGNHASVTDGEGDEPTCRFITVDEPPPPPPRPPTAPPRVPRLPPLPRPARAPARPAPPVMSLLAEPQPFSPIPMEVAVPAVSPPRIAAGSTPPANVPHTVPAPPVAVSLPTFVPIRRSNQHRAVLIAGSFLLGILTIGLIAWLARTEIRVSDTRISGATPPAEVDLEAQIRVSDARSDVPLLPPVKPVAPPEPAPIRVSDARTSGSPSPSNPISVRVTTDPPGATVVLDGVRLGTTPFVGTVAGAPRMGWLKVRKRGQFTRKLHVSLEHDVSWDVHLPVRQ